MAVRANKRLNIANFLVLQFHNDLLRCLFQFSGSFIAAYTYYAGSGEKKGPNLRKADVRGQRLDASEGCGLRKAVAN